MSEEVPDLVPTRKSDAVLTLTDDDGRAVFAIVVEVRVGREKEKWWSWPLYVAGLRARLRCPVVVLVVCPERSTAEWAADPIELGPGSSVTPLVLGPEQVPVVSDLEQARRSPQLAVLSALTHGMDPGCTGVLDALVAAFGAVDRGQGALYHDLVQVTLPLASLHYLEAQMSYIDTYVPKSEWARSHYFRGVAEGEADAVLRVLAARGVAVSSEARDRITGCTELDQIKTWLDRAITATSVQDLFA